MQFLVDDNNSNTLGEFYYDSNDCPTIASSYAEEAAEVKQQARAIDQHYISQCEISLHDSKFDSQPMHQAAQQGMDMYCIDVPVSGYHSLSRH